MTNFAENVSYLAGLRERAMSKLTDGIRGNPPRTSTSEAMAVLYKLASSPDTAGDAQALLHELQVHQVEVDMQHEELRRSRIELENDLVRQTNRFEQAPMACLVVDADSVLCEVNGAGVRLLGFGPDDLLGRPFAACLAPDSRIVLLEMLAHARGGRVTDTFELRFKHPDGADRKLYAVASEDASPGRCLLAFLAAPAGVPGASAAA